MWLKLNHYECLACGNGVLLPKTNYRSYLTVIFSIVFQLYEHGNVRTYGLTYFVSVLNEWDDKSTKIFRNSPLKQKHIEKSGIYWMKSSRRYSDIKIERRDTITANLKPSAEYTTWSPKLMIDEVWRDFSKQATLMFKFCHFIHVITVWNLHKWIKKYFCMYNAIYFYIRLYLYWLRHQKCLRWSERVTSRIWMARNLVWLRLARATAFSCPKALDIKGYVYNGSHRDASGIFDMSSSEPTRNKVTYWSRSSSDKNFHEKR